jgi:ER-bound oxygenase mpaB/B'/Rubber oxygenase, catalytic domain
MTEIGKLYFGRHRLVFRIGTYLALIRMMGISHLVTVLYGHTKLVSETHARLARTRQTLRDLICHGFESPAGCRAMQRLRDVHRNLNVSAEDYRYVLGTFFLEPLRWSEQHGRKRLTQSEVRLLLTFWTRVGQSMDIPDLPSSLPEWKESQRDYEAHHMHFTSEGQRLAAMCLRDVVKLSLPIGMRALFRQMMLATIEPAVRQSLRIPGPRWYTRATVGALLRIMG